ncbi:MAG: hypothetical protein ABSD48_01485 [Armatimonadota bacterium]
MEPSPFDTETFGEWVLRNEKAIWRWIAGPPPELTEADIVAEGAFPICPSCTFPHHPLATRCRFCNEIVSRYATSMGFVWIWVWGPKLQRVMKQRRLTPLLCAGLVFQGAVYVVGLTGVASDLAGSHRPPLVLPLVLTYLISGLIYLVGGIAGFRMMEAGISRWGTWRERREGDDSQTS